MSHRMTRSKTGARVIDGKHIMALKTVNINDIISEPDNNKYFNLIKSIDVPRNNDNREFAFSLDFEYLDTASKDGKYSSYKTSNPKQEIPLIDVRNIHLTIKFTNKSNIAQTQTVTKSLCGIHYFVQAYENETLFNNITDDQPETTQQKGKPQPNTEKENSQRKIQHNLLDIVYYTLNLTTQSQITPEEKVVRDKCIIYLFNIADIIDRKNRSSNVLNQDIYNLMYEIKGQFMQVIKGPLEIFKTVSVMYWNREVKLQEKIKEQQDIQERLVDAIKSNEKVVQQQLLKEAETIEKDQVVTQTETENIINAEMTEPTKLSDEIDQKATEDAQKVVINNVQYKEARDQIINEAKTYIQKSKIEKANTEYFVDFIKSQVKLDLAKSYNIYKQKTQSKKNIVADADELDVNNKIVNTVRNCYYVNTLRNTWNDFLQKKDWFPGMTKFFTSLPIFTQEYYANDIGNEMEKVLCAVTEFTFYNEYETMMQIDDFINKKVFAGPTKEEKQFIENYKMNSLLNSFKSCTLKRTRQDGGKSIKDSKTTLVIKWLKIAAKKK